MMWAMGRVIEPGGADQRTVLVVDDSVDALELFRISLGKAGYQVLAAANGMEALELMREGSIPNAVVVDLMMPVMDGMELIEQLRSDERLAHLPIVVVSAVDVPPKVRLPHTRYLRKPYRTADLLANLDEIIRSSASA
jgi:CheY-like chemotaxis protein